ncbi:MAG: glycosyltransferase, partial [Prevotella sp.]
MKHYLLTRFNLRLWPHNKVGEETQTEAWLRRRVELFERYTLPSVVAQSCLDFVWI